MGLILKFAWDQLVKFVFEGLSGRGAIKELRESGYTFTDKVFWDQWRTAVGYEKGKWGASQLDVTKDAPWEFTQIDAYLDPDEVAYRFSYSAYDPVREEHSVKHMRAVFDQDLTIEEATWKVEQIVEEEPTERYPWSRGDLVFTGKFVARGTTPY